MEQSNLNVIKTIRKLNYKDLIIFLIPCIIFLYYLHVFDPGILRYDSYNQFHQIATNNFKNWHPFFHTFIEMLCIKIYPNLLSVSILQIFTFSTIWMFICKFYRNEENNNRIFLLQAIITLIIALIPINAIYSITLLKDILFSYFMLLLCFLIAVFLDKNCKVNNLFLIIISATMAVIAQLRPNGLFIILTFLVILCIYIYRKNKSHKLLVYIPLLTIVFILLIGSLNMAYDVEDNQKDAVFAKVGHMLVDYDLNLDLNKGDRTKIHKIIDEKSSKEKYVITYSDPIYFNSHKNVYEDNKTTYIWMAIKYSIKNPIHFVEYLFGSSPMVWDITRDDDWVGIPYETNITKAKDDFYNPSKKYVQTPTNYIDNATAKNSETSEYKNLESLVNYFRDNQITDTLFYSPALYMFLAFISMILIHWITKSKEIYLIYLPNMLNIIVIFLSTPIQDYRYLYPNLLVFYMILIMLISIYQKSQIKAQSF